MSCQSGDRVSPRSRFPHNEGTAGGSSVPTCPTTPRLPHPSGAGACTDQTHPQSASQKPPIALSSAASPPPGTGGELGGQLTRYKRRTNDPLRTASSWPGLSPPSTSFRFV